jgi:hypothetical protein
VAGDARYVVEDGAETAFRRALEIERKLANPLNIAITLQGLTVARTSET